MIIKNGCATLRAIEEKDFELLFHLINDPNIEKTTGGWHLPLNSIEQKTWMANYHNTQENIRLMIELENGKTIGMISLADIDYKNGSAEIHYKIFAPVEDRIKGDMHDAITGILNYAFNELRLNCVFAVILEYNIFGLKLIQKMNFKQEGILRKRKFKNGQYHNQIIFSLLNEEFNSN